MTALRWQPGHYLQNGLNDTLASIQAMIASLPPSCPGVNIGRYWAGCEPSQGVYDFSFFRAVAAGCAAHGKFLIAAIVSRAFGGTSPGGIVPQYLINEGLTYSRTTPSPAAGATLWREAAMDAKIAAEKALISELASGPALVLIGADETVYGQGLPGDYTAAQYVGQEIRRQTALRAFAPAIGVLVYSNWINGDDNAKTWMQELAHNAAAVGGIFINGGPDALYHGTPNGEGNGDGYAVMAGRIGPTDYRGGKYPLLCGTQSIDFAQGATPAQIFQEFDSYFGAPYQSWSRYGGGNVSPAELLAFLAAHPVTHTAPPQQQEVVFTGPIPNQVVPYGKPFSLDLAPYFKNATSYAATMHGTSGLALNGSVLSGTAAGAFTYVFTGSNQVPSSAQSNPVTITIGA